MSTEQPAVSIETAEMPYTSLLSAGALAPVSGAPDALTAARPVTPVVRWLRLLRVGVHLARGVAIMALLFFFMEPRTRRARIERWCSGLLAILAVKLDVTGAPPLPGDAPLMIVANHISWLDIIAINAVLPVRFVAKSEVQTWPVIGWMCEKGGTIFIRRGRRRDIVRVNALLAEATRASEPVAVFPEGTTTDGTAILKFNSSLLKPATSAPATLFPVAIRYTRPDGTRCPEAAFVDGKSVWDTLKLMTTQREIAAHLAFLPPLEPGGRHRRELAMEAREAILRSLFPVTAPHQSRFISHPLPVTPHQ